MICLEIQQLSQRKFYKNIINDVIINLLIDSQCVIRDNKVINGLIYNENDLVYLSDYVYKLYINNQEYIVIKYFLSSSKNILNKEIDLYNQILNYYYKSTSEEFFLKGILTNTNAGAEPNESINLQPTTNGCFVTSREWVWNSYNKTPKDIGLQEMFNKLINIISGVFFLDPVLLGLEVCNHTIYEQKQKYFQDNIYKIFCFVDSIFNNIDIFYGKFK